MKSSGSLFARLKIDIILQAFRTGEVQRIVLLSLGTVNVVGVKAS
jgi:hypothetical protein